MRLSNATYIFGRNTQQAQVAQREIQGIREMTSMPVMATQIQERKRGNSFGYWHYIIAALLLLLGTADFAFGATEKPQSWAVDCPTKGGCVAHLDTSGAQILIGRAAPDAPLRMALRVAASAKTGAPVALRLDDGWQAGLLVGACLKTYCEVAVAAKSTDVALAALSKNSNGLIAYQAADRLLLVPFSLTGFKEALNEVKK